MSNEVWWRCSVLSWLANPDDDETTKQQTPSVRLLSLVVCCVGLSVSSLTSHRKVMGKGGTGVALSTSWLESVLSSLHIGRSDSGDVESEKVSRFVCWHLISTSISGLFPIPFLPLFIPFWIILIEISNSFHSHCHQVIQRFQLKKREREREETHPNTVLTT